MQQEVLRIVYADDDREDFEMFSEAILELEPAAIIHHERDGFSLLEYLRLLPDDELPCLIMLDYNMPGMKGAEVLDLLCLEERYLSVPKVVVSTSVSASFVSDYEQKGSINFFTKPPNMKGISEVSEKVLGICKAHLLNHSG
jgi:CheY-like chemotaxis protein